MFKQVDIVVPELLVEELLETPLELEVLVGVKVICNNQPLHCPN